jgi:D-glycero-beta-D-manno-heptose 1-phosphate adenylyltransferase
VAQLVKLYCRRLGKLSFALSGDKSMGNVILDRNDLAQIAEQLRAQGKTIVTTNGCFDILHLGHVRILEAARKFGDVLLVGVNSDDSVKRLKGPTRPVNNEMDRAEVLAALKSVDYVWIFHEDTPVEFLKVVKPQVHVKGADYAPSQLAELPVVEGFGGRVELLKLVPGKSTTGLLSRISNL